MKLNERGFHLVEGLIVLAIIGVVGLVGARVMGNKNKAVPENQSTDTRQASDDIDAMEVRWKIGEPGSAWKPSGKPPKCSDPVLSASPIDVKQASEILYPGQYRGAHYKAHGGFNTTGTNKNLVTVKLPMDMRLVGITHYLEGGEIQYLLDFEHPCGIQVRFDHLLELAPEFAAITKSLPAPTESTQSVPPGEAPQYTKKIHPAGTIVATKVGHTYAAHGSGFDFGLYDLRQPNEISKNAAWAALHINESSQTFYAVCWIDWLPAADRAHVMTILPLATDDRGASDYCSFDAGGSTMNYNNGQPVMQHATPNRAR